MAGSREPALRAVLFWLGISPLLLLPPEQENKTALFVDSSKKNKRLGESFLQALLRRGRAGPGGAHSRGEVGVSESGGGAQGGRRQEARTGRRPARCKHTQT